MIITFFGHRDFYGSQEIKQKMHSLFLEYGQNEPIEFFLGGYGNFDNFAHSCAREYKNEHPSSKLIFVTPYIDESFLKTRADRYDETVFPNIENTPRRFRIKKRNEYMVDKADLIISCIAHKYGGAYDAVEYARKKNKNIINLI